MRRWMILLAVILPAAPAGADTIYLKDKTLEGKATRAGDKYVVELTLGGKMEVDVKDVVYILASDPASSADIKPAAPQSGPASTAPAEAAMNGAPIDPEAVTLPETMTFAIMRALGAVPAGDQSFELRKQLEIWRAAIHDRKRKIGPAWALPKDFIHARAGFLETSKEAVDLARKAKGKPNAKDLMAPAYDKFRRAANGWKDPLLRTFLLGLIEYQSGNPLQAYADFQLCRKEAPYIPAFAQGEAMALGDLDRAAEALAPAGDFLRMRPDLLDAFDLLKKTMARTPGSEMRSPTFLAAKDFIGQYQEPAVTSGAGNQKVINWQMPGKPWAIRDDATLPEPPMDRLIVRQAVAVPVASNLLLVDATAVNGAAEVFVRIDGKTMIEGTVRKPTTSAKNSFTGVALVHVATHSFTALGRDQGADSAKDADALVCAIGMYPEMGPNFRQGATKVHAEEGAFRVPASLAAGEAASPVFTESGQLLCFLTGRMDPSAENGGPERVIPLSEIGALIKAATIRTSVSPATKLKRTGTPAPVKGSAFIVYGIFPERFENK